MTIKHHIEQSLNIIVFGANGRTGLPFVEQALAYHNVIAVVRRPELFPIRHPKLRLVKGDVLAPDTFDSAMEEMDVVVSALGVRGREHTVVLSQGVTNIMSSMKRHQIKRFMALSALGIEIGPDIPIWQRIFTKYILQKILSNLYADTRLMEKAMRDSQLDWTIIRPPMLTNGKPVGLYRFAINDYLSRPFSISRIDLAAFMLRYLEDKDMFRAVVEVGD